MTNPSFHETLDQADDVKSGSDRAFGFVFAVVFAIIGLFPLWNSEPVRVWALIVAAVFFTCAWVVPKILAPLNRLWFRFGLLLHKIVSPLIMALIFFGCVFPISLLMRLFRKRPLDLAFRPEATSYWIHRPSPSPEPGSMKRQF